MGVISIVNEDSKPAYNWEWYHPGWIWTANGGPPRAMTMTLPWKESQQRGYSTLGSWCFQHVWTFAFSPPPLMMMMMMPLLLLLMMMMIMTMMMMLLLLTTTAATRRRRRRMMMMMMMGIGFPHAFRIFLDQSWEGNPRQYPDMIGQLLLTRTRIGIIPSPNTKPTLPNNKHLR